MMIFITEVPSSCRYANLISLKSISYSVLLEQESFPDHHNYKYFSSSTVRLKSELVVHPISLGQLKSTLLSLKRVNKLPSYTKLWPSTTEVPCVYNHAMACYNPLRIYQAIHILRYHFVADRYPHLIYDVL